jgi:hypothetical protein
MQQSGMYFDQTKTGNTPTPTQQAVPVPRKKGGAGKVVIIILSILVVLIAAGTAYWFFFRTDLTGKIVIPYIAHQKPRIDPHIPSSIPIADKLDEVIFDGLFNVSANPSGVTYQDGLG